MRALSIVAPAYNEERRLPALFERVESGAHTWLPAAGLTLHELIVVVDGSADGTAALLKRKARASARVRAVSLDRHRGKGAAVRAGMLAASGELMLLTDVDMSAPLDEVATLAGVLDTGFDLVLGLRAVPGAELLVRQRRYRELAGKGFNRLLRLSTCLPFLDTQCGFKLFRAQAARTLFELQRLEGYTYDAELCVNALRIGLRVAEVPVRWSYDPDSRVRLIGSSGAIVLDLLRLGGLARRPGGLVRGGVRQA